MTDKLSKKKNANFFANLKIQTKILGGFGVVILGLALVSGIGFSNFVTVGHDVDILVEHVEEAALAGKMESTFYHYQMYVRDYAGTGDEQSAKTANELAEEFNAVLGHAEEKITQADQAAKIAEIKENFELFEKDFHEVIELEHEFKTLLHDKLDPAGEKFIEDMDKMIEAVLTHGNTDGAAYARTAREHALKAEVYANIMIGRNDSSFSEKTHHEFAEAKAALDALGKTVTTDIEKELYAEMVDLLSTYVETFEKVVEDEHEIANLVHNEMANAAKVLTDDARWLEEELAAEEEAVREETMTVIANSEQLILIISIISIIVGIAMAWIIGRGIASPAIAMTNAMQALADGDTGIEIPAQGRKDEIGEMAAAVQVFKENAIARAKLEADAEQQKIRTEEEKRQAMNQMADEFDASVGSIVDGVSSAAAQMQVTANSLTTVSERTNNQATTVASASEEASSNVQTVASAAEELAGSITEISRQVSQSSTIAQSAVIKINQTNEQIQGLAVSADRIGEVIAMITDIADQTNLLALNATIEAARAGDAGKGFAVVASEVKNLATQTAKATDEISTQVSGVQAATKDAVTAIEEIKSVIGEMDEIAASISAAVEEQGAATQEISRNVQQAASGTQEVSASIQGVTQSASETGEASGQVLTVADQLSGQASTLKTEVINFIKQVRNG